MVTGMARWGALACAGALLYTGAAASEPRVPAGTVVMLEFMEDVGTRRAKRGDEIKLRVYTDVVLNGKTLIRQDAPARGVVKEIKKPGPFGKRARLLVRLEDVKDVNGDLVSLEPYSTGGRFRAAGPGASGAGLLVLGPAGLVGGAFIRGSHVTIKQGTRIQAKVAEPGGNQDKDKDKDKEGESRKDPSKPGKGVEDKEVNARR